MRKDYGYTPSDEVVIDICIEEIMEGEMKKFDPSSIISEYPDEFIRKMRLTGLLSLRGAGRFLDINHNDDEKVEYVLEHYSTYPKFETERAYFDYMARIDENLFTIVPVILDPKKSEQLLLSWLTGYSWDAIKKELHILATKSKTSKDQVLKLLPSPARLEFLTSLAIKSKLPKYQSDSELSMR